MSNNVNNMSNNVNKCKFCLKLFKHQPSKSRHEKNCNQNKFKKMITENIEIKKENIEIKNMLKQLIEKNNKIQSKTLQKINNNNNISLLNKSNTINIILDNELQSNKIIKSNDNKFFVDLNKNFMTFNDKPIKFFYYNNQIYYKASDIALILDDIDIDIAIQKNVDNEDIIIIGENIKYIENEDPLTIFINEFGLYSLILTSKNEDGKKFRRWITLEVFPLIIKNDDNNLINNYIEEDLDKYYKKDCVYIIHIKDNIYKYGNTSHLFKRLQAHKTNLKYNKIIKIYDMNNMNDSRRLENKIKKLVKTLNINIIYNNHIEIFQVNNNDLEQLIEKFDELSLTINNDLKFETSVIIEKERTKQLELENENLKLKLELLKLSK
jgi:prophage antirepressor-like protein